MLQDMIHLVLLGISFDCHRSYLNQIQLRVLSFKTFQTLTIALKLMANFPTQTFPLKLSHSTTPELSRYNPIQFTFPRNFTV